jgi:type I restriction enzyme S subunit
VPRLQNPKRGFFRRSQGVLHFELDTAGAAIATNKKRLTSTWSVFDPNIIGIVSKETLSQDFIFQWFQNFDLRKITEPGPTPQLNKKNLEPVIVPVPPTIEEQTQIVTLLSAIDDKITLHKRKKAALEALFTSLLHQLMTGKIRVGDLDLSALSEPRTETA